jgi:hypothetical protein
MSTDNPIDNRTSAFATQKVTPRRITFMDKPFTQMSPRDSTCSGTTSFRQKFKTLQHERAKIKNIEE